MIRRSVISLNIPVSIVKMLKYKGYRTCLRQIYRCFSSEPVPNFLGAQAPWTEELNFVTKASTPAIPVYRVLNENGHVVGADPCLPPATLLKMYKSMRFLNIMDKILYESQRQGRISFYMTNYGEEASHVGSAAALALDDVVYGQYREVGVLVWRGFTAQQFVDQCYGNCADEGKGRQMPVHYGSRTLNFVTISSPLSTQMPQAAGAAYTLKGTDRIVVCYYGDGAASEGDAHAAFNFAATLECPVVLFCRNNGYAISTPVKDQYAGDGIAARGPAYGIHTLRVDGNDILAVYNATKLAREYCVSEQKPVVVEALSYRSGHHSTSDDSSAYRTQAEIEAFTTTDPVKKFQRYLSEKSLWNDELEKDYSTSTRNEILTAFAAGEKKLKPQWTEMFHDVYSETPAHLKSQMEQMRRHVTKHKDKYPVAQFTS